MTPAKTPATTPQASPCLRGHENPPHPLETPEIAGSGQSGGVTPPASARAAQKHNPHAKLTPSAREARIAALADMRHLSHTEAGRVLGLSTAAVCNFRHCYPQVSWHRPYAKSARLPAAEEAKMTEKRKRPVTLAKPPEGLSL